MQKKIINGSVTIGNGNMDYVAFGKGKSNLVMIPGLADAFKTVKGMAVLFSYVYRAYAKRYRVYIFSRKRNIQAHYCTKDMADDLVLALEQLNIDKASFIGISQGGMIAQHVAIKYPQVVDKLVLAVSAARPNNILVEVINIWLDMAKKQDYESLITDTAERSYSDKKLRIYKAFLPVLARIGKPKDFTNFIIQAQSCITHNAYDELNKIGCKTLIIGAEQDKIVGVQASIEMSKRIQNSKLVILKGFGHAAYEESKDFNKQILLFFDNL